MLWKMDGLLTAVKTVTRDSRSSPESTADFNRHDLQPRETGLKEDAAVKDQTSSTHILGMLRSKPERDELFQVLKILDPSNREIAPDQFDIRIPSPISAQILQVLVSITIPDVWSLLNANSKDAKSRDTKLRAAMLRCLSSVAGVSSLIAQLRSLITASRSSAEHAQGSGSEIRIRDILEVLAALLEPKDFLLRLYTDISTLYHNETQKQITWRELMSLVAASRILSTAAESLTLIKESTGLSKISWVGEGPRYASWIGDNICYMASKADPDDNGAWKSVSSFTGRALSLGYTGNSKYRPFLVAHDLLLSRSASQRYIPWSSHRPALSKAVRLAIGTFTSN